MSIRGVQSDLLAGVWMGFLGLIAGAAGGAVWPGAAPCNTTLQACIDGTASGETIELATNGPILESVVIEDKTLTLEPAAGFVPVFGLGAGVWLESITSGARVLLDRLTFDHADVVGQAGSGRSLWLEAFDCSFTQHSRDAIRVTGASDALGVIVDVRRSNFTITNSPGFEGAGIKMSGLGSSSLDLFVTDNVFSQQAGDSIGAISLFSTSGRLVANLTRNEIRRSGSNRGIFLRIEEPDEATIEIHGNLIVGSPDTQGEAVSVTATDEGAELQVLMANNTFADGNRGVLLAHLDAAPDGALTGEFENNIVANFPIFGYDVQAGGDEDAVENHHNLFWNAASLEVFGPATLQVDPLFVGAPDYRLRGNSPARNAGVDAGVSPQVFTDLDGYVRQQDGAFDLGAYESPGSVLEIPTLSQVGLAAMIGLLIIAAWRRIR